MDDNLKQIILDHVAAEFPREACGLIVDVAGQPTYFPCRNDAVGTDQFILNPEDYLAAENSGPVISVVHSHPNGSPQPSQADLVSCEASGLPWHIVNFPDPEWVYFEPSGYEAPLIGRVWSHGVLDCYTIIRDWYKINRGITLPDFERHDEWWQQEGNNLYVDNFQSAGFVRVEDGSLQAGDVLLMQIRSKVPNHGVIYLGDDIILHHLHNRLSCREIFGGYYKKHCVMVLRYAETENNP